MLLFAALVAFLEFNAFAQGDQSAVAPEIHRNAAIIPVSHTGAITNRQALVLERAKADLGKGHAAEIG